MQKSLIKTTSRMQSSCWVPGPRETDSRCMHLLIQKSLYDVKTTRSSMPPQSDCASLPSSQRRSFFPRLRGPLRTSYVPVQGV